MSSYLGGSPEPTWRRLGHSLCPPKRLPAFSDTSCSEEQLFLRKQQNSSRPRKRPVGFLGPWPWNSLSGPDLQLSAWHHPTSAQLSCTPGVPRAHRPNLAATVSTLGLLDDSAPVVHPRYLSSQGAKEVEVPPRSVHTTQKRGNVGVIKIPQWQ